MNYWSVIRNTEVYRARGLLEQANVKVQERVRKLDVVLTFEERCLSIEMYSVLVPMEQIEQDGGEIRRRQTVILGREKRSWDILIEKVTLR